MLVLFENLTCLWLRSFRALLLPLAWDSKSVGWGCSCSANFSIAFAIDQLLLEDHALYCSGGGAKSLPHVELFLSFAIELLISYLSKESQKPTLYPQVSEIMYTVAPCEDLFSYCISSAFHGRRPLYTSVRFLLIYQTSCRLRPSVW